MSEIKIEVEGLSERAREEILTPEAIDFVVELHKHFARRRMELLEDRQTRAAEIAAGGTLDFLEDTRWLREDDSWRVAPPRDDYADRRSGGVSVKRRRLFRARVAAPPMTEPITEEAAA